MSSYPSSDEVNSFRDFISERIGFKFSVSDEREFENLYRARRAATGWTHPGEYLRRLRIFPPDEAASAEMRVLTESLTVGETYFFRHPDQLTVFETIALPERIRIAKEGVGAVHGARLRILSAGCSSGEEPYSLAILSRLVLASFPGLTAEIIGIDINRKGLEKAREGRYTQWSLRSTPDAQLSANFERVETGQGVRWVLDPRVRSLVRFVEGNLSEDDAGVVLPCESFEIIFCRNMTIYFSAEVTKLVIERLTRALVPGGFLFLGPSETLRGVSDAYHLRQDCNTFYYQKRRPGDATRSPRAGGLTLSGRGAQPDYSLSSEIAARKATRLSTTGRVQSTLASLPADGRSGASARGSSGSDMDSVLELVRSERFDLALTSLRSLPAAVRESGPALLTEAAILANGGQTKPAEKICHRILELDECNEGAHYLLALCLDQRGELADAAEHDLRAIATDASFAMPHLHLGLLARRSGENRDAAVHLRAALGLLAVEDVSRVLLFGGGFDRDSLMMLCRSELTACGGDAAAQEGGPP